MSRLYRTPDYQSVWLEQWGAFGTRHLVVYLPTVKLLVDKQTLEWGEKSGWLWEKMKVNRLIGYRSPQTCCVQSCCQHWARTCGQETHTHLLHADYHEHVRGWTKCGVEQLECLSFCVNVHMCTRLNKIHGFDQIIYLLSCAFSLHST